MIKLVLKRLSLEGKLPEVLTSRLKCGELVEITLPDNREWLFQVVKLGSNHRDMIRGVLSKYPFLIHTVLQSGRIGSRETSHKTLAFVPSRGDAELQ